jgi:spermidine synthase
MVGTARDETSMKRFVLLDTAPIPDSTGALCLFEYGEDFVIKIAGGDGGQLMNTRMHGSEDALAAIPCRKIAGRPQPRVLIGGLGMGFTLASALLHLGADAEVAVAELVPGVVEWNRGPLGGKSGYPLLDPRTRLIQGDVAEALQAAERAYDAIMLDVDNGPEGLTQKGNGWLYSAEGLRQCHRALRPKGILAVWSASADRRFSDKVRNAGFKVEEVQVHAHGNKGTRHTIWIAERQ